MYIIHQLTVTFELLYLQHGDPQLLSPGHIHWFRHIHVYGMCQVGCDISNLDMYQAFVCPVQSSIGLYYHFFWSPVIICWLLPAPNRINRCSYWTHWDMCMGVCYRWTCIFPLLCILWVVRHHTSALLSLSFCAPQYLTTWTPCTDRR